MLFELGRFATATNRRPMLKHAKAPEDVSEHAQEQVDRWKGEGERPRQRQRKKPRRKLVR